MPGFVDSAREATERRPLASKESPRPCQIIRGSWVVEVVEVVVEVDGDGRVAARVVVRIVL